MELTLAQLSVPGPVRQNNEDFLGFWQPDSPEERRQKGAVAIIADGVGGHGHGEIASRLAVETALRRFVETKGGTNPNQMLWQMFNMANLAVYDAGMLKRDEARMATTLTISLFHNTEVTIGHVGDCRVYLIHQGRVQRVTSDHSLAASQVKLGLLSEQEAMTSPIRSVLTRSIGKDPTIQVDFHTLPLHKGDCLVQCTDGMHVFFTEQELADIVTRMAPQEACKNLVALAERRGTDDNLSVQIIHIDQVEHLIYYRGLPIYQEIPDIDMSSEIQVGQVLDDRFHITGVISRSGMASIFKAKDLKTGKTAAIKAPFMQYESDPGFFSRFQREEAIGQELDHPSILHLIKVEEQKSRPYIAMEFLEGQTLRKLLHSVRPLPVPDALQIAARICDALDYMHKHNIVHRDLKPENVMLCEDGSLRIMDFGIAKAAGMRRLTFSGFSPAMGTPDYMAPEQVKGKRGDERTDIYSLGAMLYEMVTGIAPFEGANPYIIMNARLTGDPIAPRKVNPEIPPEVEEIILHAMERNPYDRYPSAATMKAELEAPEKVQLTGRHERLLPPMIWKTKWRNARLIIIALLIPVVVFGLMYLFYRVLGKT